MWFLFSTLGAFFQALGFGALKKGLQVEGIKNTLALFINSVSALTLGCIVLMSGIGEKGLLVSGNARNFWLAVIAAVLLNVIGQWFSLKALSIKGSELSHIMPFMALSPVITIIPSVVCFGLKEIPSLIGFLGIVIAVTGAIFLDSSGRNKIHGIANRKAVLFFLVTLLCYSLTPVAWKIAGTNSTALYTTFIINFLGAIAFIPIVIKAKEIARIKEVMSSPEIKKLTGLIIVIISAGIFLALEGWSITTALTLQKTSYVMAVKRLMPFFALLIGFLFFKEQENLKGKMIATSLLVGGAIAIALFG